MLISAEARRRGISKGRHARGAMGRDNSTAAAAGIKRDGTPQLCGL